MEKKGWDFKKLLNGKGHMSKDDRKICVQFILASRDTLLNMTTLTRAIDSPGCPEIIKDTIRKRLTVTKCIMETDEQMIADLLTLVVTDAVRLFYFYFLFLYLIFYCIFDTFST